METRGRKKSVAEPAPPARDPQFELLHPDQGESLVIQRVLNVAPSKSIDDDSWRRNNIFRKKCNFKDKMTPEFELLHPEQGESLVIQRVLNVAPSKSIDDDSWRRNNIFRTKCNFKDKVCNMINDGGSCKNVVPTYMVEKLALKTMDHPKPDQLTWLKKGNAIK
nr:reverse transcriptase domain-containing protein [Tanacetum cinerariifolium]